MADYKNYVNTTDAQTALEQAFQKGLEKAEREGVKKASQYVAQELEKNTPYWYGGTKKHASKHIVYSNPKNGEAFVGYDKDVAWRMHFLEFGTEKQPPQAIVEKTQKQVEQEVIDIIKNVMKGVFN